ncbi:MAG: hypothetical protein J0653_06370, partial [Deltaproteobacteria bacterium]|nr:hypothetical protein [Deltaproteobacteria bacterium]
ALREFGMSPNQAIEITPPVFKTYLLLAAAVFLLSSTSALATPKAAEHENAPVTKGAEVAKPRILTKPMKTHVTGKKKSEVKKTPHDAKSGKKAGTKK